MAFGGGGMAGSVGLGFVMSLKDNVTGPAMKIHKSVLALQTGLSRLSMGFGLLGGAMAGMGGGIAMGLAGGVKAATRFEGTLKTIQGITGAAFDDKQLDALGSRIDQITSTLPMSSQQMADAMQQAAQQGLVFGKTGEEAAKTLERIGFEAAQLSAITGDMTAAEALGGMGATLKQFNLDISENAGALSDSMVMVRNSTRATVPWLMEVNSRAAGTAKTFGLTAAEFQGVSGVVADVVKQPQGAASGLTMIFNSILKKSGKFAKLMGMDVKSFQAAMMEEGGPSAMFQGIVGQLSKLDKFQKAAIFKELGIGGRFATRVMNSLIAANDKMIDGQTNLSLVIGQANAAWLAGMRRGNNPNAFYERMSKTAGALFATFQGNIENIKKQLGKELLVAVKPLLNALIGIQTAFLAIEPAQKRLLVVILGIVSAILTLSGMLTLVIAGFMMFGTVLIPALLVAIPLVLGVAAAIGAVVGALYVFKGEGKSAFQFLGDGFNSLMLGASDFIGGFINAWRGMGKAFMGPWKEAGSAISSVINELLYTLGITGEWGDTLKDLGTILGIKVGNAIKRIGQKFNKFVQKWYPFMTGFVSRMEKARKPIKAIGMALFDIFEAIGSLGKRVLEFFGLWSDDGQDAMGDIAGGIAKGEAAADRFVASLEKIAGRLEKIDEKIDAIDVEGVFKGAEEGFKKGIEPLRKLSVGLEGVFSSLSRSIQRIGTLLDTDIGKGVTVMDGLNAVTFALNVQFGLMALALNQVALAIELIVIHLTSMGQIVKGAAQLWWAVFGTALPASLHILALTVKQIFNNILGTVGSILQEVGGLINKFTSDHPKLAKMLGVDPSVGQGLVLWGESLQEGAMDTEGTEKKIAALKKEITGAFDPAIESFKEAGKSHQYMGDAFNDWSKRTADILGMKEHKPPMDKVPGRGELFGPPAPAPMVEPPGFANLMDFYKDAMAPPGQVSGGISADMSGEALKSAIAAVTVEPEVDNTVNLTTTQNFTVPITAHLPGVADAIKGMAKANNVSKREQVTQSSEGS